MRIFRFAFILFILIRTLYSYALDPARGITQYVHRSWRIQEGLPESSIYAIHQTRDGYVWLGIEEGLVRFDGVRFRVFNKENTPGLNHNFIWTFFEAKDG